MCSNYYKIHPTTTDGKGLKMWQNKMIFFLKTLKLHKFIKKDEPVVPHGNEDDHTLETVEI